MGRFYCEDGLYEHEGYLALILPDGTDTSTHGHGIPSCIGHVPACACDWRGTPTFEHPGEDWPATEDELLEEWENHIADVRARSRSRDLYGAVNRARAALVGAVQAARAGGIGWNEIGVALYPLPTNPVRWYLGEDQADEEAGDG